MEKLKEIIQNNRMSARPEYYSGRGATISDLNDQILEGIYQGIKKEYGDKPAENFVKMVEDITILSATTFLQELYDLFNCNWKYKKKKQHAIGITIQKNENGEYDEGSITQGIVSIFSAILNSDRDDTNIIKGHFLRIHGIKPKELIFDNDGRSSWYY
jgi:hypothetical protein